MINKEQEKQQVFSPISMIEYGENEVKTKVILEKITGNVEILSLDFGTEIPKRLSAFDILILIIDGEGEIIIRAQPHHLGTGDAIIIPAHSVTKIRAKTCFKMLSITIKSGYEGTSINIH